ncbi:MAG: transposase, partial [Erysipelotrichaceae bacterium]
VYFKKSRSVLLKRSKHLIVNETINEVRQRDRMLEHFPDLKKAYDLKEEILWMVHEVHDLDTARIYLNEWIRKADASGIPEFKSAVTAYRNWKIPILNAFAYPYSNGITEGCNNKIKVIKRNAFGLRNFDRFRTRILLAFG